MQQKIIDFVQDEAGDWKALLVCGHAQHVRHNPPWQSRPWVVTEAGRQARLGLFLDCRRCDREGKPVGEPVSSANDD